MRRKHAGLVTGILGAIVAVVSMGTWLSQRSDSGSTTSEVAGQRGGDGRVAAGRPYIGKPQPPVRVRRVDGAALHAGVSSSIQLEVMSRVPLDSVTLRLAGDRGLQLESSVIPVPDVGSDAPQVVDVRITPVSGGAQRLAGGLQYQINGEVTVLPVSLPMDVAGPVTVFPTASKPERLPQRDASGELVYPLPSNSN